MEYAYGSETDRDKELRRLIDQIPLPQNESFSDISSTSYLAPFDPSQHSPSKNFKGIFNPSINSTIVNDSIDVKDQDYQNDPDTSQIDTFTPQQMSRMMDWSRTHITPAEGLFPQVSAPSMSLDVDDNYWENSVDQSNFKDNNHGNSQIMAPHRRAQTSFQDKNDNLCRPASQTKTFSANWFFEPYRKDDQGYQNNQFFSESDDEQDYFRESDKMNDFQKMLAQKEQQINDLKTKMKKKPSKMDEQEIEDLTSEIARLKILNSQNQKKAQSFEEKAQILEKKNLNLQQKIDSMNDHHQKQIKQLEFKIQDYVNNQNQYLEHNNNLQRALQEAQETMSQVNQQKSSEQKELKIAYMKINSLEQELEDLKKGRTVSADYEGQMLKIKQGYEIQIDHLKAEMIKINRINTELSNKIQSKTCNCQDEILEKEETIQILQDELQKLQNIITDLNSDKAYYKASEEDLQKRLLEAEAENESLNDQISSQQFNRYDQYKQLEQNYQILMDQNSELRRQLEQERQRCRELQNYSITSADREQDHKYQQLRKDLQEIQEQSIRQKEKLQNELTEKEQKLNQMWKQNYTLEDEKIELQKQLEKFEQKRKFSKTVSTQADQERKELMLQIEEKDQRINKLSKAKRDLRDINEKLQQACKEIASKSVCIDNQKSDISIEFKDNSLQDINIREQEMKNLWTKNQELVEINLKLQGQVKQLQAQFNKELVNKSLQAQDVIKLSQLQVTNEFQGNLPNLKQGKDKSTQSQDTYTSIQSLNASINEKNSQIEQLQYKIEQTQMKYNQLKQTQNTKQVLQSNQGVQTVEDIFKSYIKLDQYNSRIEQKEKEIEQLNSQAYIKDEKIVELEQQLDLQSNEAQNHMSQAKQLGLQIKKLRENIKRLEESNCKKNSDIMKLKEQNIELEESSVDNAKKIKELQDQFSHKQQLNNKKVKMLQDKLNKKEEELQKIFNEKNKLQESYLNVQSQFSEAKKYLTHNQNIQTSLEDSTLQNLHQDLEAEQIKNSKLIRQYQEAQKQIQQLKESIQLDNTQEMVQEYEDKIKQSNQKSMQIQQKMQQAIQDKSHQLQELNQQLVQSEKKYSKCEKCLQKIISEYKSHIQQTKGVLKQQKQEKQEIITQNKNLRIKLKQLKQNDESQTFQLSPEMLSPEETCKLILSIFKKGSNSQLLDQLLRYKPNFIEILHNFLDLSHNIHRPSSVNSSRNQIAHNISITPYDKNEQGIRPTSVNSSKALGRAPQYLSCRSNSALGKVRRYLPGQRQEDDFCNILEQENFSTERPIKY